MSLDIAPLHWTITAAGRLEADGFGGVYAITLAIDLTRRDVPTRVMLHGPKVAKPRPAESVEHAKNAAQRHYEADLKSRVGWS